MKKKQSLKRSPEPIHKKVSGKYYFLKMDQTHYVESANQKLQKVSGCPILTPIKYIRKIFDWFGLVLWHINHQILFLHIYQIYMISKHIL